MILEKYKVFEKEMTVQFGFSNHTVKTLGFVYIKYSLKQKLKNLFGFFNKYSPVFLDVKIKQEVVSDNSHSPIFQVEQKRINQAKASLKIETEKILYGCRYQEWDSIEARLKRYIIFEECSVKESYIHCYGKFKVEHNYGLD